MISVQFFRHNMVGTSYSVSVAGRDPDPVFVSEPSMTHLNQSLVRETGLPASVHLPDMMCYLIMLKGESSISERETISGALYVAYGKANPGMYTPCPEFFKSKINYYIFRVVELKFCIFTCLTQT